MLVTKSFAGAVEIERQTLMTRSSTRDWSWRPGSGGAHYRVPPYAFVFLVTLGTDYNIFLMTRVREQAAKRDTTLRLATHPGRCHRPSMSALTARGEALRPALVADSPPAA